MDLRHPPVRPRHLRQGLRPRQGRQGAAEVAHAEGRAGPGQQGGGVLFVISAEKCLMTPCVGPGQPDDLRARAVRYRGYPGRALRRGQLRGAGADRRGHAAPRPGRGAGRAGGRAGGGRSVRAGGQV